MKENLRKIVSLVLAAIITLSVIVGVVDNDTEVRADNIGNGIIVSYDYGTTNGVRDYGFIFVPDVEGELSCMVLMHGGTGLSLPETKCSNGGVAQSWMNAIIKKGNLTPRIVVMPMVPNTTIGKDKADKNHQNYDYPQFLNKVFPLVLDRMEDGTFNKLIEAELKATGSTKKTKIDTTEKTHIVTGYSMGGSASLYVGAKYKDRCPYIGALSPSDRFVMWRTDVTPNYWMGWAFENSLIQKESGFDLHKSDPKFYIEYSGASDRFLFMSQSDGEATYFSTRTKENGGYIPADKLYKNFAQKSGFEYCRFLAGGHDRNTQMRGFFCFMYQLENGVAPSKEKIIKVCGNPSDNNMVERVYQPDTVIEDESTVTPTVTEKPTVTPTKKPTVTPTKKPTVTPTKKPTVTPTKKPTVTPTKKPIVTPTPTATPVPQLKGKVELSGTPECGQTMTVKVTGGNADDYIYLWQSGIHLISKESMTSYTLTDNEVGKTLKVVVRDKNDPYGTNRGQLISNVVTVKAAPVTPKPIISATPTVPATPKVTATPTVTAAPKVTSTPEYTPIVSATPTATPVASRKIAVSSESVTDIPEPTVAPVVMGEETDDIEVTVEPTRTPDAKAAVVEFVNRIYEYVLDREPETAGAAYWTDEIWNFRRTGADVGLQFILSDEFTSRNTSDEEFVKILYNTFFGREPEEDGVAYWTSALKDGSMDRQDVANGFVYSDEWADTCASYGILSGGKTSESIEPSEETLSFVDRMYTTAMSRESDEEGMAYWANELSNFRSSGEDVGMLFFMSDEMESYDLTDKEFLTRLYKTFMDREPESDGLDYWLNFLKEGNTRDEAVAGFTRSEEFIANCIEARVLPYND